MTFLLFVVDDFIICFVVEWTSLVKHLITENTILGDHETIIDVLVVVSEKECLRRKEKHDEKTIK